MKMQWKGLMIMYGYICPYCGDHLDPGEKCDCMDEKIRRERRLEQLFTTDSDGQITLREAVA
jgi:hypothetical protein